MPTETVASPTSSSSVRKLARNDYVECLWKGKWQVGRIVCVNNTRQPPEEWADNDTVNVQLPTGTDSHAIGVPSHHIRYLRPLSEG